MGCRGLGSKVLTVSCSAMCHSQGPSGRSTERCCMLRGFVVERLRIKHPTVYDCGIEQAAIWGSAPYTCTFSKGARYLYSRLLGLGIRKPSYDLVKKQYPLGLAWLL